MSIRDAFLADIAANPEDDAPRLVFADWLEENGEPERALFIRVQCCLAQMDPYDRQRRELVRAEQKLLRAFGNRWAEQDGLTRWVPERPLDGADPWVRYRRGFVEYSYFQSPGHFLWAAEPLSRRAPLREVGLSTPQAAEGLAEERLQQTYCRLFMEVRGLQPSEQDRAAPPAFPEPEEFRRLVASPLYGRLRGFRMRSLYFEIGRAHV